VSLGCGVGAGVLVAAFSVPSPVIPLAIAAGTFLPLIFVRFRVRRRAKAFEDQLPDILSTLAASLKAGHSFKHGLQAVVDESQPPASNELQRVLTEVGLGRPMDEALADMADRVGSENFNFTITAVTIQRQVGGSLASLFDMVAETVRNRQQFARKIRSLTAMGRMSAYTLAGIPLFGGYLSKEEILGAVWGANLTGPFLLLMLVAGLTAFYMFRLYHMTFSGSFRGTHEQEHHVHESPKSMTIPLQVLAVGSVIAGFAGIPHVIDFLHVGNALEHWLEPVFESANHTPTFVRSDVA